MAERALATAYVNIVPGTKDFDTALKSQITGKMPQFGQQAGKNIGSNMASGIKRLVGPAIAAIGIRSVVNYAKSLSDAAEGEIASNNRITQIAKSMGIFGNQAEAVSKRLQDVSQTQQLALGIDDDTIKMTQAKLLTFKELAVTAGQTGGMFDRANMAAQDMAAAGFGEATMNAVQLGKALNDPVKGVTALGRSGITFTEQEKKKIETLVKSGKMLDAQNLVMKAIETQVGGTAKATAKGSDRMKQGFANLKETLALKLQPTFEKFYKIMADDIIPKMTQFVENQGPKITTWAENASKKFATLWPDIKETAKSLGEIGKSIAISGWQVLLDTILILGPVIKDLARWLKDNKWLVMFAIQATIAFKAIKGTLGIITGIKTAIATLSTMKYVNTFLGLESAAAGSAVKISGIFTSLAARITLVIGTAIAAFQGTSWLLNNTQVNGLSLSGHLYNWGQQLAGRQSVANSQNPYANLPKMANGGIVTSATNAIIGEAGPEAVIPLKKLDSILSNKGGGVVIHQTINPAPGMNEKQLADMVARRTRWELAQS